VSFKKYLNEQQDCACVRACVCEKKRVKERDRARAFYLSV